MSTLAYGDGTIFADGVCPCRIEPLPGENSNRILVDIELDSLPISAAVDTGGVYIICVGSSAEWLRTSPDTDWIEPDRVSVRGVWVHGRLCRATLTLPAKCGGHDTEIQVTAFVPNEDQEQPVPATMLGLTGCMERFRFAVDPGNDMFYFGAI